MMGMDSKKLSKREKQPGHDRSFVTSEANFIEVATRVLGDEYLIEEQPGDLKKIFENKLGVVPEAVITSKATGRKLFVEVKKQGPRGNAEERAYKHHTVQFYRLLKDVLGYNYHPFVTIFCDNLATDERYTLKAKNLIESDNYFLWVGYNEELLAKYLRERCQAWLD